MDGKHTIQTACTNDLPADEHKMFETRRRCQELNLNINWKECESCWFTLLNCIKMNGTKNIK